MTQRVKYIREILNVCSYVCRIMYECIHHIDAYNIISVCKCVYVCMYISYVYVPGILNTTLHYSVCTTT